MEVQRELRTLCSAVRKLVIVDLSLVTLWTTKNKYSSDKVSVSTKAEEIAVWKFCSSSTDIPQWLEKDFQYASPTKFLQLSVDSSLKAKKIVKENFPRVKWSWKFLQKRIGNCVSWWMCVCASFARNFLRIFWEHLLTNTDACGKYLNEIFFV